MMKFKKYLIRFFLVLLIITTFACEDTQTIYVGHFEKPIDIASISGNNQNGFLILDNQINQLFLYDLTDECYLDFSKTIPLNNGLTLPKFPYKLTVSDDNKKAVVLSSNGVLSIIDLTPFYNFYEKDCKQSTLPFLEYAHQSEEIFDDVVIKKTDGFNYELLLINKTKKSIEFYDYDGVEFLQTYTKTYESKISYLYENKDGYYISLEGEKNIIKISSDGSEEIIDVTDISTEYNSIDRFLVTDNYIYIYSQYENKLFVWDTLATKYIDIKASYNPLDLNSTNPSKSLSIKYNLTSMSLYKQEYNINDDEFLNGLGYLNLHQLIEGNYLLLTDVGGYLYFLTIDTDKKLIKNYPEDDYSSLEEYNTALDTKFLQFQIPLQTDYNVEVLSVLQPDSCTQFNKHEANQCFYVVNEDESSTDNKYIMLKDEVKNREYDISNDYFKFTFEGALKNFIGDDGSFTSNNKLNSIMVDFDKLEYEAKDLQLEIISELPESKLEDSKCEKYRTITDEKLSDETNRKYFRLVPISSISGHEITLDITNDENLSYCYDEAIAFQLRLLNLFLVSTTEHGEIGSSSYCTNDSNINPLCNSDIDNDKCPIECENAPFYENDLFKIKIFSDKGEMDIDSYVSFSLGVTSTMSNYRDTMISPLKTSIFKNNEENQSKNGIAVVDSYMNDIFIIDTNSFDNIITLIQ